MLRTAPPSACCRALTSGRRMGAGCAYAGCWVHMLTRAVRLPLPLTPVPHPVRCLPQIEEHKWPLGSDVVVRAKMGAAVTKEVAAAARAAKAEARESGQLCALCSQLHLSPRARALGAPLWAARGRLPAASRLRADGGCNGRAAQRRCHPCPPDRRLVMPSGRSAGGALADQVDAPVVHRWDGLPAAGERRARPLWRLFVQPPPRIGIISWVCSDAQKRQSHGDNRNSPTLQHNSRRCISPSARTKPARQSAPRSSALRALMACCWCVALAGPMLLPSSSSACFRAATSLPPPAWSSRSCDAQRGCALPTGLASPARAFPVPRNRTRR